MAKIGVFEINPEQGDEDSNLPVAVKYADPVVASGDTITSGIGAVIADTGALPAGAYRVEIVMGFSGIVAAGKHLVAQHRNAANAANIHSLGNCPASDSLSLTLERVVLALNERIRVVVGAVAAALNEGTTAQIRVYLL